MAATYASKYPEKLNGLVLLAAYSTADLTDSGLDVLSIYGSEDGVLNMEKYESNRGNLPKNTAEVMIPGGNHAGFGSYGAQDGDGEAGLSAFEQINYTADIILEFFKRETGSTANTVEPVIVKTQTAPAAYSTLFRRRWTAASGVSTAAGQPPARWKQTPGCHDSR